MMFKKKHKILCALIFYGIFLCATANANNNSGHGSSNAKLKGVLRQITKVKTDLTQKKQQQTSVQQQLDNLKGKIVVLEKNYGVTTKNLKHQRDVLAKLAKDYANQQIKLQKIHDTLTVQINLAYQIDHPDAFKNIFGEKDKVKPELLLAYHRYIALARLEQMRDMKDVLSHLEQNRQKIKYQTKELEKAESKQQRQKLELEKTKQDYNNILSTLKIKIDTQSKKLKQLLLDKQNLEKLIDSLISRQVVPMSRQVKTRLCKNFVWPAKGVIVTHFGSSIEQSSWTWSGVMVRVAVNQAVHAMAGGKVVYAGLLAGYGLLLIIDHENGYMSLYGHNSSLHKRLHANVVAGEVIATVGKSNTEEPELYFSIRYNGKPIDPERWCK